MVRAELGVGNIDGALALLKRIKARFVTSFLGFCFLLIDRYLVADNTQTRCIIESVGS